MIQDERPDEEREESQEPEAGPEEPSPEESVEEVGAMGAETVPDADASPDAEAAPDAEAEPPASEPEPTSPEGAVEEGPAAEEGAAAENRPPAEERTPAAEETPTQDAAAPPPDQRPARPAGDDARQRAEEVVPGADLEPDLVLEGEGAPSAGDDYADAYAPSEPEAVTDAEEPETGPEPDAAPVARTPLELAADARYQATGKRKTSVARVILKPGEGSYTINGRPLEVFFPRPTLQRTARLPLDAAGYSTRMDVVARIHGGGVSSQAGALRHGVARALVEADPNLRGELKRRGFLTRDARAKERKKAGLKKARKRPQFSKR